jgi:hypothetical protein
MQYWCNLSTLWLAKDLQTIFNILHATYTTLKCVFRWQNVFCSMVLFASEIINMAEHQVSDLGV